MPNLPPLPEGNVLPVTFNDREVELILALADHFDRKEESCNVSDLPGFGEDPRAVEAMLMRFRRLHLTKFESMSGTTVRILPDLVAVAYRLRNPPKPNHWQDFIEWWFSKKWSIPVTLVAVVLPLLVQWVEMLKAVVGWVAAGE